MAICLSVSLGGLALAAESGNRKELKRVDLSGAPGMEVIASMSEYKVKLSERVTPPAGLQNRACHFRNTRLLD